MDATMLFFEVVIVRLRILTNAPALANHARDT